MFGRNKKSKSNQKYMGILLRKENTMLIKIAEQQMKLTDKSIIFREAKDSGEFTFERLVILYRDGNINYMFFDMESKGAILSFNKIEYPIHVKDIDALVRHNIVVGFLALIKGAFDKQDIKGKLIGYIVVGIMGGAIGWIVNETMGQNTTAFILTILGGV